MSKLSLKGVLLGGITDIVATNILALPIIVYVMLTHIDLAHLPSNQVAPAVVAALHASIPLNALQILVGSVCSILGGYVGARVAKHDELLNGALTSVLCMAFGIYSLSGGSRSAPVSLSLMSFIASPALGLLGGYLRSRQKRAKGAMLPPTIAIANQ
jgi:hypothetical protein